MPLTQSNTSGIVNPRDILEPPGVLLFPTGLPALKALLYHPPGNSLHTNPGPQCCYGPQVFFLGLFCHFGETHLLDQESVYGSLPRISV